MQSGGNLAADVTGLAAFKQGACEFFDEQRDAAGALNDRRDGFVREGLLCDDLGDHATDVAGTETIQVDLRVMRTHRP